MVTWVLVHFSLRYSDDGIGAFFSDGGEGGLVYSRSAEAGEACEEPRPPDIVLWLDTGVRELWVDEVRLVGTAEKEGAVPSCEPCT